MSLLFFPSFVQKYPLLAELPLTLSILTCLIRYENKPDNLNRNLRVWFDRSDAYLFGVCMENVNLALFFSNYSQVRLIALPCRAWHSTCDKKPLGEFSQGMLTFVQEAKWSPTGMTSCTYRIYLIEQHLSLSCYFKINFQVITS